MLPKTLLEIFFGEKSLPLLEEPATRGCGWEERVVPLPGSRFAPVEGHAIVEAHQLPR